MSLFGSRAQGVFPPRARGQTDGELRKLLNERGAPRDSTILTKTELDIIREMIAGKYGSTALSNSALLRTTDATEDHKRRMMDFDEERRKNGETHRTAEEIEQDQERQLNLVRARAKLDEECDEVRAMNRVLNEARCVAIREAQREELKKLRADERLYNEQMDAIIAEEEKLAQQVYLERERARLEEQRLMADTLKEQLHERDVERVRRLVRLQDEQDAMTRHLELLSGELKAEKLRRKAEARRLMEDAAITNAEQVALREKHRQILAEEDSKMAEYIKQREEREQAHAEEKQRIRDEKEREIAKLRSQQEQAQNKQEQIDELRAKRVADAYAREQRRKEKEAAEHQAAMYTDLQRVRGEQIEERRRIANEAKEQEQVEMDRILAVQKVAVEQERARKARAAQLQDENSLALLKQIMEVEERRRLERLEEVEEGHQKMREHRERQNALERIREQKLNELDALQVPSRYRRAMLNIAKK